MLPQPTVAATSVSGVPTDVDQSTRPSAGSRATTRLVSVAARILPSATSGCPRTAPPRSATQASSAPLGDGPSTAPVRAWPAWYPSHSPDPAAGDDDTGGSPGGGAPGAPDV